MDIKKVQKQVLLFSVLALFVLMFTYGNALAVEPTTFPTIEGKEITDKGTAGVTIVLTSKQAAALTKADGKSSTVTLTEEQFKTIKLRFPNLKSKTLSVSPTPAKHYIPVGAKFSAKVTGISKDGLAKAILLSSQKGR